MLYKVEWDESGVIKITPHPRAEVVKGNIERTEPFGRAGSVRVIVESFCGPRHQWCQSERDAALFGARLLLAQYRSRMETARSALARYTDWLEAHNISAEDVDDAGT